jgi:hypothetical protein
VREKHLTGENRGIFQHRGNGHITGNPWVKGRKLKFMSIIYSVDEVESK